MAASYLRPGLNEPQAGSICMNVCRAGCCRGPLLLELSDTEIPAFVAQARRLSVELKVNTGMNGGGWVKFSDHVGERCPMLDPDSAACRIYGQRPMRCREFPERPTTGCPISGG